MMDTTIYYGYADTSLGQVHYREAGSGPPLVLFHESPTSGRIFERTLPILGRRVRAIAPDTPGYGASAPPPEPLSIAGYAERLSLFLDALGLERVALHGNRTGAAVAIQLTVDQPERVPALVSVGCPFFNAEDRRQRLEAYAEPLNLSLDGAHLAWVWGYYKERWGEDTPLEFLELAATEVLRVGKRFTWGELAAARFEADRLLPKLQCPALFLATHGDRLRGKNEQAAEVTPDSEVRLIDLPHGQLALRDPDVFAEEVLSFLDRVNYLT